MLPYIFQLAGVVGLPLLFVIWLWRSREADRCRWLLKVLYTGAFLAYMFALGRWDFSSLYLRYVIALTYVAATFKSHLAMKGLPFFAPSESTQQWTVYAGPALLFVFFSSFLGWAARGYAYSDAAVELEFPLRNGWFYVGQGGNSLSLNYHNANRAQQYALDIVALNRFGSRASGLYPKELTSYTIFGEPVYSPCAGRVEAVVADQPDQIPPNSDKRNVAGNHVVISCAGVLVVLAHLQADSVLVQRGDVLTPRARLGSVGNSGNTSEPHLHIHAVRAGSGSILKGHGVPMVFHGMFPVRNTTFRSR